MDSVMVKMIVVSALVISLWATIYGNASPICNNGTFPPGSAYEANVATVLEGMRLSTASVPNRVFNMHLTFPDVYGNSSCSGNITVQDCLACLTTTVNAIKASCVQSLGASDTENTNCHVEYHT